MSISTLFGIAALVALIAFIILAFRQGMQVKPDPENKPPNIHAP